MIYSKEDVKRILAKVLTARRYSLDLYFSGCSDPECCGDSGTPQLEPHNSGEAVKFDELKDIVDDIETKLEFEDDGTCGVCRGSNGKHSSLCGEQY